MSSVAPNIRKPKASLETLLPAISTLPVRRFSLEEYHYLIETGFLGENDRVELLNGWIVAKMGINPPHASAVSRLSRRLERLFGDAWVVRQQSSISIPSSDSEPEPDIVVVSGPEDAYDARHPYPDDIALLVEVADSSLKEDRGEKLQTYAAANIEVYWILNLQQRRIEVYTNPRGGRRPTYRKKVIYAARGSVTLREKLSYAPSDTVPVAIGSKRLGTIPVDEVLP